MPVYISSKWNVKINPGDFLTSFNGNFIFTIFTNGNLCCYNKNQDV